ncbi:L-2,4-diaminobutyrate decarboxylase [Ceratocystis lukuohia]|uniref:L-2,4-diaminobutyrate decarboxylase n=1 Tax=Ceratocystis lukuohia TaxID=2019550 RepID=A0ABR4MU48_9PEZI
MSRFDLQNEYAELRQAVANYSTPLTPIYGNSAPTTPPASALAHARSSLPQRDSPEYLSRRGPAATLSHIRNDILPALSGQGVSARYFGFVTGGVLPEAEAADNIVSAMDQNAASHIPDHSVAVDIEHSALNMLADVLGLEAERFTGSIFTTGATASNILGLACGREAALRKRLPPGESVARLGLLGACAKAGVTEVQVLTSGGHSSLSKAAAVVGLGWDAVKEVSISKEKPWKLDIDEVERRLQRPGVASIISISMGEVNTGLFATNGRDEMQRLRKLADRYSAWLHVDGDDSAENEMLKAATAGLELADSITADAHKILNAPYDCGVFYTAHKALMQETFRNPNAAYLANTISKDTDMLNSPLDMGLENSRRFRALPIYAILVSLGRQGLTEMVKKMVAMTRALAREISRLPKYEMLPMLKRTQTDAETSEDDGLLSFSHISFILMVRLRNREKNKTLVCRINESREVFVSGSVWNGVPVARIAVSSHRTTLADVGGVVELLKRVAAQ